MTNFHILSISSVQNKFTFIEVDDEVSYVYQYNEERRAFNNLEVGDKILGFIEDPINEIRFGFYVKETNKMDQVSLVKEFEVFRGANVDKLSEDVRESILTEGEEGELVKISKKQYDEILDMITLNEKSNQEEISVEFDDFVLEKEITVPKLSLPYNYIVFGAPGTGKSYDLKDAQETNFKHSDAFERVTFYSNYTYQNFVGTYKPRMDGNDIKYDYTPGPFIRTLIKAYENPDKNYLLLIEEINRANPAAVFGDIFQLLDRKNGRSEYDIETSEDLREYLATQLISGYKDSTNDVLKKAALKKVSKIFIPKNMYIWATMNSADQGVFPVDTAFKRRWDFKYIGIDENSDEMKNVMVKLGKGKYEHELNWNKLRIAINDVLYKDCKVNEDKLLGPYFISKDVLEVQEGTNSIKDNNEFIRVFKSKVLMYLFEDAAKQKKDKIFDGGKELKYSSICERFEKVGEEVFVKAIREVVSNEE